MNTRPTKRASYINFSHCIPHPKPNMVHCNQHVEYTTPIFTYGEVIYICKLKQLRR
ncbi:hypothetical protein [Candidatus Symbiopectobacterium sp.]|uniref:hypothetical protein n=1 Tax=Candidatus Symbiopectobacterium sp. TaxID=2816440 RepID=UPI0025BAAE98|nr:hypothetical protein [Candidatus Symbiopectobacterium sp.]